MPDLDFQKMNPFASQAKLLFHYDKINQYMSTGDTYPLFMEVNLTNNCNLKCKWCISENRNDDSYKLDVKAFKTFALDFRNSGGKALTFSGGGEPTSHPAFIELSNYVNEIGLDLGLMTNGVFSKEKLPAIIKNFNWIRISLDTVDTDLYKELKGLAAVDIAINNCKALYEAGKKVGINCNIGMDLNVNNIDSLIEQCINISSYIQFRPVLPRYFNKESVEFNTEVWNHLNVRYRGNNKIIISNDKIADITTDSGMFNFEKCDGHVISPILNADGNIMVCMYHLGDDNFSFGNINTSQFINIWNSSKRQEVIRFVESLDYTKNCQACCKLSEINKVFSMLKRKDSIEDINFL